MKFFTIGIFDSTEQEYFEKLTKNDIDTFLDIRQNSRIKKAEYKFADTNELPDKLKAKNIKYTHLTALAPTKAIRELQKKADIEAGIDKKDRTELSEAYTKAYQKEILNNFDFESFIKELEKSNSKHIVLFCVEKNPRACHRFLTALELEKLGYEVKHL